MKLDVENGQQSDNEVLEQDENEVVENTDYLSDDDDDDNQYTVPVMKQSKALNFLEMISKIKSNKIDNDLPDQNGDFYDFVEQKDSDSESDENIEQNYNSKGENKNQLDEMEIIESLTNDHEDQMPHNFDKKAANKVQNEFSKLLNMNNSTSDIFDLSSAKKPKVRQKKVEETDIKEAEPVQDAVEKKIIESKKDLDEDEKFLLDYIVNARYFEKNFKTKKKYIDREADDEIIDDSDPKPENNVGDDSNEKNFRIEQKSSRATAQQRRRERKLEMKKEKEVEIQNLIEMKKTQITRQLIDKAVQEDHKDLASKIPEFSNAELEKVFEFNDEDRIFEELDKIMDGKQENNNDTNIQNQEISNDVEGSQNADRDTELKRLKRKQKKKEKKMAKKAKVEDSNNSKGLVDQINELKQLEEKKVLNSQGSVFMYRKVLPNDYGLTADEILGAEDGELNSWANMKKVTTYNDDDFEKKSFNQYRKKGSNRFKKENVFKSLYKKPPAFKNEPDADKTEQKSESKNEAISAKLNIPSKRLEAYGKFN